MAKILIAEDERQLLAVMSKAVNSMGHIAIKSRNGRVAWDILCDNPDIELLITDVSMPEMDGKELVKRARQDSNLSDIPILIMSGVIRAKDISDLLKVGATAFLPKPVAIKDLKDFINKNLP